MIGTIWILLSTFLFLLICPCTTGRLHLFVIFLKRRKEHRQNMQNVFIPKSKVFLCKKLPVAKPAQGNRYTRQSKSAQIFNLNNLLHTYMSVCVCVHCFQFYPWQQDLHFHFYYYYHSWQSFSLAVLVTLMTLLQVLFCLVRNLNYSH